MSETNETQIEVNPELKNIIEAALLVAGQPLTIEKLMALFSESSPPERDEIRVALEALQEEYAQRGIELKQIDRGYRIQSREKYSDWLARLSEERPARYSRAMLETLAIIAYRQPVTRGDIEEIRGVTVSTEILRSLQEREWIRQVGHRDVPGKPGLYGTTRAFLEYFNLTSLEDLPTLAELRDLDEISKELNLSLNLGENPANEAEAQGEAESPAEEVAEQSAAAVEAGADMEDEVDEDEVDEDEVDEDEVDEDERLEAGSDDEDDDVIGDADTEHSDTPELDAQETEAEAEVQAVARGDE